MAKMVYTDDHNSKLFSESMRIDANHTNMFRCCHGAVEQDNQISRYQLNYYACVIWLQPGPFSANIQQGVHPILI